MKLLKTLMAILFAASLLTACGGKDKKEGDSKEPETKTETTDSGPSTKLEGAWEIKRAEGSMDSLNLGTVYEFKGSKLSFGKGDYKNPGKTEVTDSTFSFQAEGNELKFMYNYKLNGDTLVVEMQNSGGQIFHMVKK
jgi:major membrane immunogen (membrane-anchored lipoprotein)